MSMPIPKPPRVAFDAPESLPDSADQVLADLVTVSDRLGSCKDAARCGCVHCWVQMRLSELAPRARAILSKNQAPGVDGGSGVV